MSPEIASLLATSLAGIEAGKHIAAILRRIPSAELVHLMSASVPEQAKADALSAFTTDEALRRWLKDNDVLARNTLLERIYQQLLNIAASKLHRHIPAARRHETASIADTAILKCLEAIKMDKARPTSLPHLISLIVRHIRWTILDILNAPVAMDGSAARGEMEHVPAAPHTEAGRWERFFAAVEARCFEDFAKGIAMPEAERERHRGKFMPLDDDERSVFQLTFFWGCTQQQIAQILGLAQPTCSRLYHKALTKLKPHAPEKP